MELESRVYPESTGYGVWRSFYRCFARAGEVGPDFQAGRRWERPHHGPAPASFRAPERGGTPPRENFLSRGVSPGRGSSSPPARPEVAPHLLAGGKVGPRVIKAHPLAS